MTDYRAMYDRAAEMARKAHEGQTDHAGKPYINHPLTVASYCSDPAEKVCALLHDTLEDTDLTETEIRDNFGDRIADTVKLLTRSRSEDYMTYVKRLGESPLARNVKLADLKHNMDLTRNYPIREQDVARLTEHYVPAFNYLMGLKLKGSKAAET